MAKNTTQPVSSLRVLSGAAVLFSGFLSPLATPLVWELPLPSGFKTLLSGALVFGIPEVMMIAGIALMGKPAWEKMKAGLKTGLSFISPQHVSRTRYYIGVSLFSLCLVEGVIELHFTLIQDFLGEHLGWYQWMMNILFLVSFFVAGGDFWDKIRSLFIYDSPAQFQE